MRAKEDEMAKKKPRGTWGHAVYDLKGTFLYWSHEPVFGGHVKSFMTEDEARADAAISTCASIEIRVELLPQYRVK